MFKRLCPIGHQMADVGCGIAGVGGQKGKKVR